MRVASTFSGIGGFDLGFERAGMSVAWQSETDEAASRVLARHWPEVVNLGDVAGIRVEQPHQHAGMGRRSGADHHLSERGDAMRTDRPRPSDERAQRMYARYRQGLSLADVAAEFGVTRQSVYGLFATRGWELRPRPAPQQPVEFNGRRYTLRNTGYYGCTTGDRHLLHRAVWEHHNGTIPDGYDVHHRDGDKTNNDPANLECLPKEEHTRRYSTRCNQFGHGDACDREGVVPSEASPVDLLCGGFP